MRTKGREHLPNISDNLVSVCDWSHFASCRFIFGYHLSSFLSALRHKTVFLQGGCGTYLVHMPSPPRKKAYPTQIRVSTTKHLRWPFLFGLSGIVFDSPEIFIENNCDFRRQQQSLPELRGHLRDTLILLGSAGAARSSSPDRSSVHC
jgi:hypothetical protein